MAQLTPMLQNFNTRLNAWLEAKPFTTNVQISGPSINPIVDITITNQQNGRRIDLNIRRNFRTLGIIPIVGHKLGKQHGVPMHMAADNDKLLADVQDMVTRVLTTDPAPEPDLFDLSGVVAGIESVMEGAAFKELQTPHKLVTAVGVGEPMHLWDVSRFLDAKRNAGLQPFQFSVVGTYGDNSPKKIRIRRVA